MRPRSRISPTRRAPPASRRAHAWRTSRPCGPRAASPSGCGSGRTTCRSVRPPCRAPISWSATCCRRWRDRRRDQRHGPLDAARPARTRSTRPAPRCWSAIRRCSKRCWPRAARAAARPAGCASSLSGGGPVPPTLKAGMARRAQDCRWSRATARASSAASWRSAIPTSSPTTTSLLRIGPPLPDKEVRIFGTDDRAAAARRGRRDRAARRLHGGLLGQARRRPRRRRAAAGCAPATSA